MHRRVLVLVLVLALAMTGVAGCKKKTETSSGFPKADKERTTEKPVEPIRWPLTGMDAPSEEAIAQRVVSVKIENSSEARPQTNIQLADVVYEMVTEGGITRFNAIFHSQAPENVGPVRSARLPDLYIVPQYHALFAFSGASDSVNAAVRAAGIENLSEDAGVSAPYRRSNKRAAPHNLYSGIPALRQEAAKRGMKASDPVPPLAFDHRSAESTPTITQLVVPFSPANTVQWSYDAASKTYLRTNNGRAFTDEATGKQVHATNVVVIWAQHNAAGNRDVTGSTTFDIVLAGSGRAAVFRNGQRFDCTWEATKNAPPTFKAADGTQVRLSPGNTWMQVVRPEVNISMQ